MTKIVRVLLGLPPFGGFPVSKFQNCFGHLVLEFEICPSTLLRVVSPSTLLRTVSLSNGLSNHL
jgi:hypothetical protein